MEKEYKKRTAQQNKALHLYFEHLAQELNDSGYDMRKTLKPTIDIPWNSKTIKEYLWRPIQNAQVIKKSTTNLTTAEVTKIYETLNRFLGEKFGLTVPFPSQEELIDYDKNSNL